MAGALGNALFVGMVAIAQNNLKSMVGYGSVMHMGYCFPWNCSLFVIGRRFRSHADGRSRVVAALMFLLTTHVIVAAGAEPLR